MHNSARLSGILLAAVAMAGTTSGAEPAREPTRLFFDNARVRVPEVRFKPGDEGPNTPRPFRVIRVLQGGIMQRTYGDGRTETVEYKTGEVKVYEAEKPFVPKNIGKSDIVLYVVALKDGQK